MSSTGFSFGGNGSAAAGGGMTTGSAFGGAASTNTNASTGGGFSFNASAGKTANTGFGAGGTGTSTGGFSLGGNAAKSTNTGFSFGNTSFGAASSTTPATGTGATSTLGATNSAPAGSATTGFAFGGSTATPAGTTGSSFSFGGNANTNNAAKPATGFGFGGNTTQNTGFGFGGNTTQNTGFGFGNAQTGKGFGFGGGTLNLGAAGQPQNPLQNLSDNKQLMDQMNKKVETLDAALQNEIGEISKLLEQQQGVIDSLGVPDEPASQEVLERLQGLQFECERMKALQDGYCVHLQTLKNRQGQFEASLKQAQALTKSEDSEGEIVSAFRAQRTIPSTFFEEVLKQVEETVNRLSDKIENMEVILSLRAGSGEAIGKEMTSAERLINIMEREYNAFIEQSAAVAGVVARMEEVKKKFLALRTKEIETRRKNLTLMSGMQDVLANVLEDPFRAESK
ncbi:hypothetical protein BLSTO_00951 [Blastocystis sp. subtype 1]